MFITPLTVNSHPNAPLIFIDSSTEDTLKADLELAIQSRGPAYRSRTFKDTLLWLASDVEEWLLIYDNIEEPELDLSSFLPDCPHGHIIITTKDSTYSSFSQNKSYVIDALDASSSCDLILTISCKDPNVANREFAEKIAKTLGYLPIALVYAAEYIYVNKCLSTYLSIYEEKGAEIFKHQSARLPQCYATPVATIIQMHFDRLPMESKQLMHLFSYFNPSSIQRSIIANAGNVNFHYKVDELQLVDQEIEAICQASALSSLLCPTGSWSEVEFDAILQPCVRYSLLHVSMTDSGSRYYSLHPVVQRWLQALELKISDFDPMKLGLRLLISAISSSYETGDLSSCRDLYPHLRQLCKRVQPVALDNALLAKVCFDYSDVPRARVFFEKALEVAKENMGEEHPFTLSCMRSIAACYSETEQISKALNLQESLLKIQKRIFVENHPDALANMTEIAASHCNLGRPQQALSMQEKLLGIQRNVLGEEHPTTLHNLHNIGVSHARMGKMKEALRLHLGLFEIRKKVLGEDHLQTLVSMRFIAQDYGSLGRHQEALAWFEGLSKSIEKLMGKKHPLALLNTGRVADAHARLGKYQKALELQQELSAMLKEELGEEHHMTLSNLTELGKSLACLGRVQEALSVHQSLLAVQTRVLGQKHQLTLQTMGTIGISYLHTGKYQEALVLFEELWSLQKELFREEHPDSLTSMNYLGLAYYEVGQYQEALDLQEKLLPIRKTVFGENHPENFLLVFNIGRSNFGLEKYEEAMMLYTEALVASEDILGRGHPQIRFILDKMAKCYRKMGNEKEADALEEELEKGGTQPGKGPDA
jgi:tetratricopeptide (TPR) repeat protein